MQVTFFAPPPTAPVAAAAPSSSPAAAGEPTDSFASLLDSNSAPPPPVSGSAATPVDDTDSPPLPRGESDEATGEGPAEVGAAMENSAVMMPVGSRPLLAWGPVPTGEGSPAAEADTADESPRDDCAPVTEDGVADRPSPGARAVEVLRAVRPALVRPEQFSPRPLRGEPPVPVLTEATTEVAIAMAPPTDQAGGAAVSTELESVALSKGRAEAKKPDAAVSPASVSASKVFANVAAPESETAANQATPLVPDTASAATAPAVPHPVTPNAGAAVSRSDRFSDTKPAPRSADSVTLEDTAPEGAADLPQHETAVAARAGNDAARAPQALPAVGGLNARPARSRDPLGPKAEAASGIEQETKPLAASRAIVGSGAEPVLGAPPVDPASDEVFPDTSSAEVRTRDSKMATVLGGLGAMGQEPSQFLQATSVGPVSVRPVAAEKSAGQGRAKTENMVRIGLGAPGYRAVLVPSETPAVVTNAAVAPVAPEAAGAARSNPVVAAPTLAQVLVENVPVRSPARVPSAPPAGTPTAEGLQEGPSLIVNPRSATALVPDAAGGTGSVRSSDVTIPTGAEGSDSAMAPERILGSERAIQRPRARLENIAGTGARAPLPGGPLPAEHLGKRVQVIGEQSVRSSAAAVGIAGAEEAQSMSAHATVLPPSTSAALGIAEPSGTSTASPVNRQSGDAVHIRSHAAAAVRETVEAAEKAQEAGRSHVELRVQTGADESLRIHLRWSDGVVHARFVAQTTEMQQALSREWDHMAPRLAEKGLKFGEASFEQRHDQSGQSSAQNAFNFEHHRQSTRGQNRSFEMIDEFSANNVAATAGSATRARSATGAAVSREPAPPARSKTEVRNLSAWA